MHSARDLDPTVRTRLVAGFAKRLLNAISIPFMAILLDRQWGPVVAGAMVLTSVLIGSVFNLLGGHLADRRGRRPVLLVGELGGAAAFGVMAAAVSHIWASPVAIYLAYVASTALGNLALPANDGTILDATRPDQRTFVYAINYWATNVALVAGSLIGGLFFNEFLVQLLAVAAACHVLLAMLTQFLTTETVQCRSDEPRGVASAVRRLSSPWSGYRAVLRETRLVKLICAATLMMSLEVQLTSYLGVRLAGATAPYELLGNTRWHIRVDGIGMVSILRAESTVLIVGLALVADRALRAVRDPVRLQVGVLAFTAGYIVLGFSHQPWLLMLGMAVATVGELVYVNIEQSLLAELVPDHARARALAVYSLHIRTAFVVGSLTLMLGGLVPWWAMPVLYAAFGAGAMLLYRSTLSDGAAKPIPAG